MVIDNNLVWHPAEIPQGTMSVIHEATHAVAMMSDTIEMRANMEDVNSLNIKEVKAQTDN